MHLEIEVFVEIVRNALKEARLRSIEKIPKLALFAKLVEEWI